MRYIIVWEFHTSDGRIHHPMWLIVNEGGGRCHSWTARPALATQWPTLEAARAAQAVIRNRMANFSTSTFEVCEW